MLAIDSQHIEHVLRMKGRLGALFGRDAAFDRTGLECGHPQKAETQNEHGDEDFNERCTGLSANRSTRTLRTLAWWMERHVQQAEEGGALQLAETPVGVVKTARPVLEMHRSRARWSSLSAADGLQIRIFPARNAPFMVLDRPSAA